ncbi:MAG: hypothetical protein KZQ64_12465 [gamma proteobacterium symbiont of Bathyaustriella thionipta]|nr:hypothetical protein [gamma proteobacterium symbiont of Bathyaustriella thionipta]MCU7949920.1 hypothetical protein [gamma proteobacterium symbiont of Bathyaustriella thionipta]MCU7954184.1 hypothetical protein [gamma proteobacterium symbiont of Bathyaustriella thionipta]MCU7956472.1 hypothetical protein [gamma proteobacterium symbiont of Bathyaustriella thionipta]MCU7967464.1 hypothetical protein [gamma proteobacterium symbiont of Bathyaustriella thionipta]
MKTLKTVLTSALFTSVAIAGIAQAEPRSDVELYNIIHPESADIFNVGEYRKSGTPGIISLHDDHNKTAVWSYEFEEYVNPADFEQPELSSVADVNQYMGSKPTASGSDQHEVFIYNEMAGEYHLQ